MSPIVKRFFPVLCVICLILTGCDNRPKIARLDPDAVILAFGDSLTYGTGAPHDQSYPAQLERRLNLRVVNAGVPGETTAEGLTRLPEVLAEQHPDLVILCLGGNDFLHQNSKTNVKENLRQMVSLIRAWDIDVILVGVPQFGLLLSPAPLYTEVAEEFKVPLEEDTVTDVLSKPALKSDRIHPNAKGYGIMAGAFAKLIEQSQNK